MDFGETGTVSLGRFLVALGTSTARLGRRGPATSARRRFPVQKGNCEDLGLVRQILESERPGSAGSHGEDPDWTSIGTPADPRQSLRQHLKLIEHWLLASDAHEGDTERNAENRTTAGTKSIAETRNGLDGMNKPPADRPFQAAVAVLK